MSLKGTNKYKFIFTEEGIDIVQKFANTENLSNSSSIKPIEKAKEKAEIIGQVFTEKTDTLSEVRVLSVSLILMSILRIYPISFLFLSYIHRLFISIFSFLI